LQVGHVDEIYSTIKYGPDPCDVAVVLASPDEAGELLKTIHAPLDPSLNSLFDHATHVTKDDLSDLDRHLAEVCSVLEITPVVKGDEQNSRTINWNERTWPILGLVYYSAQVVRRI